MALYTQIASFLPISLIFSFLCALIGAAGAESETPPSTAPAEAAKRTVYVIRAAGNVEPGMAAFIERALERTTEDPEALVVLEMDTFGGRVDSAFAIVDSIVNIPKGNTVAYVAKKAISAGALISLACNELVMKHHTTIGDCAPITYSQEGPKMMGEKFQSPLRARFRSLAKRNGYPEALSEAMVTADMTVYGIERDGETRYIDKVAYDDLTDEEKEKITAKRTVVAEGELLTMDDVEARRLGFSRMSVESLDEMLERMDIGAHQVVRIEEVWSESFVRLISTIAPVLMMIGLASLYTELQAPGFGVPGIIGIICLGLVFFGQYMVGLASYTELLLLGLGLILMGYEIFVLPGFGVAGFSGIMLIGVGMVLAFQNFVLPDPDFPWQMALLMRNIAMVLGAFVSAFVASLLLMRYIFPAMTRFSGEGPYLAASLKDMRADSLEAALVHAGDVGKAATALRPSGKVRVNGETVDAVSEAEFLEKGAPVKVLSVQGARVVVCREVPHE